MEIRFWGTRGSRPTPGPRTLRYGGNTSCVEVRLSDGSRLILDAGSGICELGATTGPCEAYLLLTHYHWDHIQGLPLFGPGYSSASSIRVLGPQADGKGPREILAGQIVPPYFPDPPAPSLGIREYSVTPDTPFKVGSADVRSASVCHPGPTLGYRIEDGGSSVVYMPDNEVDTASPRCLKGMIDLATSVDLLIHDCHYTESEYDEKRGWGHSTPRQVARFARAAGVRHLILFHHAPSRSDAEVEDLAAEVLAHADGLDVTIAREGEDCTVGGYA